MKKALPEWELDVELSDRLGDQQGDPAGRGTGKWVPPEDGAVEPAVPRDRNGTE